jgi:hypothetical protein
MKAQLMEKKKRKKTNSEFSRLRVLLTTSPSLSISSLSLVSFDHCACARPTTHPGSPTTQDNTGSCVRLNEQYSTDQSDPYGRHQWAQGRRWTPNARTVRPKPPKILAKGLIPQMPSLRLVERTGTFHGNVRGKEKVLGGR